MNRKAVGVPGKTSNDGMPAAIGRAGRSLPRSERADEIRSSLVAKAEEKAAARPAPKLAARIRSRLSVFRVPVLARAFAAAAAATLLVFSVALASTSAMPGNPLYSMKRLVERGRLAVTSSGEGRARIEIEQGARRLVELGFTSERSMETWYYPLVQDAQESLGEARTDAGSASAEVEKKVDGEARAIVQENEQAVRDAIPAMLDDEAGEVEQWLEEEKGDSVEHEQPDGEESEQERGKEVREQSHDESRQAKEKSEPGGDGGGPVTEHAENAPTGSD